MNAGISLGCKYGRAFPPKATRQKVTIYDDTNNYSWDVCCFRCKISFSVPLKLA